MESDLEDLRSSVKHFRTTYLFLGVYLIAKTEMRTRWESSITKANDSRCKKIKQIDFRNSFSRMKNYFQKKLDDLEKNRTNPYHSIKQFKSAFNHFCTAYEPILGDLDIKEPTLKIDYISYMMTGEEPLQKKYVDWFEQELKSSPNPFANTYVLDFLQLLRITYALTGHRQLKDYLENIGRNFTHRTMGISRPKGKEFRWPNQDIYNDQEMFIWILQHPNKSITKLQEIYMDDYYSNVDYEPEDFDNAYNKFIKFRGEYFPIYYWFFHFLLKSKTIKLNIQDVKRFLYLINEILDYMYRIVGKKQILPEQNLNQTLLGFTTWNEVGTWPKLPF